MDADWDLHAIVRGCSNMNNTPIPNATNNFDSFPISPSLLFNNNENPFETFPDHFDQPFQKKDNPFDDFAGLFDDDQNDPFIGLQEIYQVFCADTPAETASTNAVAAAATQAAQVFQPNELIAQVQPLPQMNANMSGQENAPLTNTNSQSVLSFPGASVQPVVRQRRRKNQQTRLIKEMTQEQLTADSGAWRKYGQKPIKGSPYPRNYYRCSTSKGCAARKQVERSLINPEIFVVSYTNDHTHPRPIYRSSLTGATRYRPNPALAALGFASGQNKTNITTTTNNRKTISLPKGSHSSPGSGSSLSPDTPTKEGETTKQNDDVEMTENVAAYDNEDDNIMMVNDLMMNDDEDIFTFKDLEESSGDFFADRTLMMPPPWTPIDYIAAATKFDESDGGGDGVV